MRLLKGETSLAAIPWEKLRGPGAPTQTVRLGAWDLFPEMAHPLPDRAPKN